MDSMLSIGIGVFLLNLIITFILYSRLRDIVDKLFFTLEEKLIKDRSDVEEEMNKMLEQCNESINEKAENIKEEVLIAEMTNETTSIIDKAAVDEIVGNIKENTAEIKQNTADIKQLKNRVRKLK